MTDEESARLLAAPAAPAVLLAGARSRRRGGGCSSPGQRRLDVLRAPPLQAADHWLDCLVGCAVGASMHGAVLSGTGGSALRVKKAKVKLSERRKKARRWTANVR